MEGDAWESLARMEGMIVQGEGVSGGHSGKQHKGWEDKAREGEVELQDRGLF
jgi:hypothetical protein